jgi:hypothetical protein
MNYFQGGLSSQLTSAGLTNPYSLSNSSPAATDGGGCCCPSSTKFLDTLTDKLIEMTQSLKEQFSELVKPPKPGPSGVFLASTSVSAKVETKEEYFIYVNRYGPPINGIFDSIYLDLIRAELAVAPAP